MRWRGWMLVLLVLLLGGGGAYWWHQDWLERSQDEPIRAAGLRYGVAPALVKAVVWRESHFNPRVVGRVGEIGLMQLREEAAREWAETEHLERFEHEHCFDPATNTLAGTFYLKKLLKRYSQADDPLPYALADYNAGRGNVLKWAKGPAATNSQAFLQQMAYPATREYVRTVLARYAYYQERFQ